VLDGQLYSAPVIRSEISEGKAQITGNFTEAEAKALATKINEVISPQ
jgi:preprotein translocase subunit SecD